MDQLEGAHPSLQAQVHIWNNIFSFVKSMSLKCAVELRIPDAIHKHGGQPVTLDQLVSALGIPSNKASNLRRLMRLLTHSGFFAMQSTCDGEDAYLLTKHSEHLLWDSPRSASPFVVGMLNPWLLAPWQSLSTWFHGDSPAPLDQFYGESFWESASQNPELNDLFNKAMDSDSHLTTEAAIRDHGEVFQGLNSLVDVGGGEGITAMALAEAFPNLKCTVLDLPHVVASAAKSTTVEFIAGDMFEYIPPADAALLKWILHDWGDEHCVKLLKLCKEAIPPKKEGGKVIIVDMLVNEDLPRHELRETQYFFDMEMMVNHGGKERSEQEWRKLFADAGFSEYKITPGLGLRSIIELYP